MSHLKKTKLFTKVLLLFLVLGVAPILLIALVLSLPFHLEFVQYKNFVGLLLILSTISTLCLAGLATRLLKHPLNQLLEAQKQVRHGNLSYRLPAESHQELNLLFSGFNKMAEGVENAAKQEQQLAEQKAFGKLASQVVHDLRSPLATLKIASDYFSAQTSADSDFEKYVELTTMSLNRLENIAASLLAKRKESLAEGISLHETMDELLRELALEVKNPSIRLYRKYQNNPLQITAEKNDLKRVFTNIITNAIEAMKEQGELTIKTTLHGNVVHIDIQDTGPGMTADILEKVLRGGFTHNKVNGNGIGMTVVREMVEKYKGNLTATSAPGQGTTFHIQLPLFFSVS